MATFTPEQRLARARMALMNHKKWCLYAGLLMLGELEIKEDMPNGNKTAATNGRDVYFHPDFINSLSEEELRFVLLHENEHKALRHTTMYGFLWKISPPHANAAADYVVNLRLMDGDDGEGFIKMPPAPPGHKSCYDTKYRGMTTKQVFDILMQKYPPPPQGQKGKGQKGDGDGKEKIKGMSEQGFDEHDVDEAEGMSDQEKEELKQQIDAALRQGGVLAGKMGGGNDRAFGDLLDSQIRWQEILAEFVKSVTKGRDNSSWQKLNRRYVYQGLYLPGTVSERVGELLVGIDSSGSTWSGNQLEGFISELIAICEDCVPEKVTVVWWDTKVNSVQEYTPETYQTMSQTLQIKGGGGTAPSCVNDWMDKQNPKRDYVAAIMLSDGYVGSDWGRFSIPVLWCLNQKGVTAPVGQTLFIQGRD